jgi:hypothetical protein
MANLTLASAVLAQSLTSLAVTIGSTTTVTDPLALTGGTHVTGLSITVDGVAGTVGTVNLPGSGNVITVPITSTVKPGQKVILTATSSNVEDSAGSPLLLSNQSVTAAAAYNTLQTSFASMLTADTTIAALQAGTFGTVYNIGGNQFVVYDAGNQFPIVFFTANMIGNNNMGGTGVAKLLGWSKGAGSFSPTAFKVPYTAALVEALFTNDPLIAYLQAGVFGAIAAYGNIAENFILYATDNTTPIIQFQATLDSQGSFKALIGYQVLSGVAVAPPSSSQVTPGLAGVTTSTGALSNVQLTATSYVPTKYVSILAPLSNKGAIYINTSSAYTGTGTRIGPGQSANIPINSLNNITTLYANFTAANDYANFTAL